MRTKTNVGEFAQIAGLFEPVPRQIEQLEASVQAARDAFTYDSLAGVGRRLLPGRVAGRGGSA